MIREPARQIVQSLRESPDDWSLTSGKFEIEHKESSISVWICNGMWFIAIPARFNKSEFAREFNLLEKFYIWIAYRKWRKPQENESFKESRARNRAPLQF